VRCTLRTGFTPADGVWVRNLSTFICLTALLLACTFTGLASAATGTRVSMHRSSELHSCKRVASHRSLRRRLCATAPQTKSTQQRSHTLQSATPTSAAIVNPAATIASILSTPCQNTQTTPTSENLQAIREATLCLINQERARNNEPPLQVNQQLQQAAQSHSEQMIGENYFAHISPAGETPLQRITVTGYLPNSQVGYTIGENIAWGTLGLATPQAIVEAWIASPEHLANILEGKYQETGIGVEPAAPASLSEGQPGGIYSQTFGAIEG
jgi:uncharacterized protein YkwD